jgi:hypothetical protein
MAANHAVYKPKGKRMLMLMGAEDMAKLGGQ